MKPPSVRSDRKLILWLCLAMLLLIVGVSLFAPSPADDNPIPTVSNTGSAGAKAALLTLQRLGRNARAWEQPPASLHNVDAARTTLILAQPDMNSDESKLAAAALLDFLHRGGRVLLAGSADTDILPGGRSEAIPDGIRSRLCDTIPEGPGILARAGSAQMRAVRQWSATGPQFRVEQRCGDAAVVVRYPVAKGEALWWASAMPLSNAGLKNDANLRLFLASLDGTGPPRDVLFDEYFHVSHNKEDPAAGLPLRWLALQGGILFALLVWSFSRRKGPIRMPVAVPRSSPLEFAQSMGDLYERAGATNAATEAARRRLVSKLVRDGGVPQAAVSEGGESVALTLAARFGGDWADLGQLLEQAREASLTPVPVRRALTLVRSLDAAIRRLEEVLQPNGATRTRPRSVDDISNEPALPEAALAGKEPS